HAQRPDEADSAERRRADPVRRADERHGTEFGAADLRPDVHHGSPWLERLAHELEDRGPALEELDESHGRLELLRTRAADEAGGAPDEHLGPDPDADLEQRLADQREERTFRRSQLGRLEPTANGARPEPLADELLLEVLRRPGDEAGIDRLVEPEHPLRHASG